ncbi:MAG: chemotaxis protein CheX [Lachnospiraceae bacterium]|nr:chemotaxis protein CheX [Lachnospiraceae bacterium]
MLTQFFGNYLLQKNIINSSQLMQALQHRNATRNKLGALAVNAGYMTESEVEEIHNMQTRYDKRFAEIAVHMGYLTTQQSEELLNLQKSGYVMLGISLTALGIVSDEVMHDAIVSYESEYGLSSANMLDANDKIVTDMVRKFYGFDNSKPQLYGCEYVTLLIKNIIRFVGNDCSLSAPIQSLPEFKVPYSSQQTILGDFTSNTFICADNETFIAFASRYAGEAFEEDEEFIRESVADFLNLHNGLFTVNISNSFSVDLELSPPYTDPIMPKMSPNSRIIPIEFTFGTVYFIFSL